MPVFGLQAQPTIAWDKTIGGFGYDRLYSVQQTADGGYILGGHQKHDSQKEAAEGEASGPKG